MSILIHLSDLDLYDQYYQDHVLDRMYKIKIEDRQVHLKENDKITRIFYDPDPEDFWNYVGKCHDDLNILILSCQDGSDKPSMGYYGKSKWIQSSMKRTKRMRLPVPVTLDQFYQLATGNDGFIKVKSRITTGRLLVPRYYSSDEESDSADVSTDVSTDVSSLVYAF